MKLIQIQRKQDDKVSRASFKRSPISKERVSLTFKGGLHLSGLPQEAVHYSSEPAIVTLLSCPIISFSTRLNWL